MSTPRITIVTNFFYPRIGGVQTIVDILARTLSIQGAEVVVVTREPSSNAYDCWPYRVCRVASWRASWQEIRKADLVIALGPILNPLIYARLARRPTIVSNQIGPPSEGAFVRFKKFLISKLTRGIIEVVCSKSLLEDLRRPAIVVPNPLRYDFLPAWSGGSRAPTVLFCGRFVPEKGVEVLIDAFARLVRCCPNVTLTLVGEGPLREELSTRIRMLGLESRVALLQPRTGIELRDLFREHAVVAVPSLWNEPFGLVAIEALASGCRVVVSDRGGLREAVGETEIIVQPTPQALMEGLLAALHAAESPRTKEECEAVQSHLDRHMPAQFVASLLDLAAEQWPTLAGKLALVRT